MPFSGSSDKHTEQYWANHFEKFLKIEIEKVPNLEARRSDELRADILKDIILNLYDSFIVVADLTDHNANVYWELGIRQSFRVKTITIAEEKTPLPFDIRTKRTLFYRPNDPKGDIEFCKNFNKALIDCIEYPEKSDSVVFDTLSGRKISRDLNILNTSNHDQSLFIELKKQEKMFEEHLKNESPKGELEFRINAYPVLSQNIMFNRKDYKEFKDYFLNKSYGPKNITEDFNYITRGLVPHRKGFYYINKNLNQFLGGNTWISTEGFIIFHFYYNDFRPYGTKKRLPTYYTSQFLLGFFDFIEKFYSKFNYSKEIKLEFMIWNLKEWKYTPISSKVPVEDDAFYRCKNENFEPYLFSTDSNDLKEKGKKIKLVEEILTEILLEFEYNGEFKIDPEILEQY